MTARADAKSHYQRVGARQAPAGLRGLIFDKDGTLFDFHETWGSWSAGFIRDLSGGASGRARALADALHFDLETQRFAKSSPMIAETMEFVVDAVLGVMPHLDEAALRRHIVESSGTAPLIEAAPLGPLLDLLRAGGYRLGVATNDSEAPARAQLRQAGILDRFDFVAGYDSGFGAKPGTGMLDAFCRTTALTPPAVAMIGDSVHDLHSGRAAGMFTIGVLTGPAEHADLAPHADVVLDHVGDLPALLALPAPGGHGETDR
jgi:phosphoglycolate phosphatase